MAVLVFIVGFIAYGGTKTNQVDQTSGTNEVEIVGGGGQRWERLFVLKKRRLDPDWNLIKVTRRGVAEIGEVVLVEGRQPGFGVMVR